jgi:hypothetical protein
MTEIFQGTLDAGIAPRRILGGHSHDETPNLPQDSWPADSRRWIRPFPGNEQPMAPQNRIGSDDRGNLAQDPASEAPRRGQPIGGAGHRSVATVGRPVASAKPDSPLVDTRSHPVAADSPSRRRTRPKTEAGQRRSFAECCRLVLLFHPRLRRPIGFRTLRASGVLQLGARALARHANTVQARDRDGHSHVQGNRARSSPGAR